MRADNFFANDAPKDEQAELSQPYAGNNKNRNDNNVRQLIEHAAILASSHNQAVRRDHSSAHSPEGAFSTNQHESFLIREIRVDSC